MDMKILRLSKTSENLIWTSNYSEPETFGKLWTELQTGLQQNFNCFNTNFE